MDILSELWLIKHASGAAKVVFEVVLADLGGVEVNCKASVIIRGQTVTYTSDLSADECLRGLAVNVGRHIRPPVADDFG